MSPEVHFTFDGASMTAREGQTLAAALIEHGVLSWRRTRIDDRPRGVMCGIGVCFDCLITLNDRPNVRACMTLVKDGDALLTQEGTGYAS